MAKEFFDLWKEPSIIKKIIAAIAIIGFLAASISSIFGLKDVLFGKSLDAKKDKNTVQVNGNMNIIGDGNTLTVTGGEK